MNYNILFGIAAGIILYLIVSLLLKLVHKSMKVNPLIGLAGIYVLFYVLGDKIGGLTPESWNIKNIETPYQMEGTLGFFLNLDEPTMSTLDIAYSVFIICLILQFIGVFLFKRKRSK